MTGPMPLILRGDARQLPLADGSVDLIVTSPPYWALRSYTDGGQHYAGQLGSESTLTGFLDTLLDCTREMVRVLKPAGSLFVNLGDSYSGTSGTSGGCTLDGTRQQDRGGWHSRPRRTGTPRKSLLLVPERYRIRCVDELGLIARAVIVWSKPNSLPESVTDRVRRSHEDWVHLTKQPTYYSTVDEIRQPATDYQRPNGTGRRPRGGHKPRQMLDTCNPLGRLPGSVWEIASQPLTVPPEQGVEHYAAFPMTWPRRLILGWSPRNICTACGHGRRPLVTRTRQTYYGAGRWRCGAQQVADGAAITGFAMHEKWRTTTTITGYTCACPDTTAPTRPGVVLDPFGGTGTTALVATMLGRRGITADLSADYCRLTHWRATNPKQRAKAAGTNPGMATVPPPEQDALFTRDDAV